MAVRKSSTKPNATQVMLSVLIYEFPRCDRNEAEKKIRRRLRYHGLPACSPARLKLLRALKDELQQEIGLYSRSRYYVTPHGPKAPNGRFYARMEDFDQERLALGMKKKFRGIALREIRVFIPYAIYLYYLR